MNKSTRVINTIKQWLTYGATLFCSPVTGALEAMRAAVNQPHAIGMKAIIVSDMHLFFAPLTGAIGGVRKALKATPGNQT